MIDPKLPLPDVPLIVEDLLVRAKALAAAGAASDRGDPGPGCDAPGGSRLMAGPHRTMSDAAKAAAAESRQALLEQLHTELTEGFLALYEPHAWQAWLRFAS